jgi:pyruvate dehydrogenase E2 component (dihydrolipoamide acetyltransferase)
VAEAYTVTTLSPIRKVIAARMSEATRSIPHFRLVADIDADPLIEFRKQLREGKPGADLSLTVLLTKACASALTEVPELNVQWAGKALHQYRAADTSVVMAIEGGVATPVVRRANTKSVWEIAQELRELASERFAMNSGSTRSWVGSLACRTSVCTGSSNLTLSSTRRNAQSLRWVRRSRP